MDLSAILEKIASLFKLFNVVEERQAQQAAEITLLRRANAKLTEQNAAMAERLARLEESRHTVSAEVKTALVETISAWEMQKLREELVAAKRKQLPNTND